MSLQGKHVILVVTGGIAAYKAPDLAGRLMKDGATVRVAMTRSACKFIKPLTFEAITGHQVYHKIFDQPTSHEMEHIGWARWADMIVVAPATADFIARMAAGFGDDAALTLYLAFRGPVLIAPAMNTAMWEHPATQANIETLDERPGHGVIGPGVGDLACGEIGAGRMEEPEAIEAAVRAVLAGPEATARSSSAAVSAGASGPALTTLADNGNLPLAGERILITAGPTREPLDPIRFISNRSSGRMGAELAAEARRLGAEVLLIHGPMGVPIPDGVVAVPAEQAQTMLECVQRYLPECTVAIFAAAVANYRAAQENTAKIKGGETLELKLVRNPDIAAWAGRNRTDARQVLAGFCAESENLIEAARDKLKAKKLDLIFANPIGVEGVAFDAEDNAVTVLTSQSDAMDSIRGSKSEVARWIWERILDRRGARAQASAAG